MVLFRWIIGLPVAALITAGLFMAMAALIQKPIVEVLPAQANPDLNIVMKPEPPEGSKSIDPKDFPKDPPLTEIDFDRRSPKPEGTDRSPVKTTIKTDGPVIKNQFPGPIIRVAPPYPEACRVKGVEGDVLVQFDVTPEGNVVNVQVIEAPDRCFNRIVSTVSKWKYPPAYQNGRPVKRYGVVEQFNFQLTG